MKLLELRSAMSDYATRFDPARVSARDAASVVADAAAIEKMAATVKSLAAARVAETELWKRDGDRSAAHQLARSTGTSWPQPGRHSSLPGSSRTCRPRPTRRGGVSCQPSRSR